MARIRCYMGLDSKRRRLQLLAEKPYFVTLLKTHPPVQQHMWMDLDTKEITYIPEQAWKMLGVGFYDQVSE